MKHVLKNKTRDRLLATKIDVADSHLKRAKGLMFAKKKPNHALIFDFGRNSWAPIHMLFVFHSIDCLWLDEQMRVLDKVEHILPFNPYVAPYHKARFMVEMPAGTCGSTQTKIGDQLSIERF